MVTTPGVTYKMFRALVEEKLIFWQYRLQKLKFCYYR